MRNVVLVFGSLWLASASVPGAEAPSATFEEEEHAPYGAWIFPSITRLEFCFPFRVIVVYSAGTDMLFVDEVVPSSTESSFNVRRGFSIREFNFHHASGDMVELACELPTRGVLRISGTYSSSHEDEPNTFRIDMDTSNGKYKYSDTRG